MSKFEHSSFYGGYDIFAVNAEKYTKEEAIEIFEEQYEPDKVGPNKGEYQVTKAWVKHRAGIDEDGNPCVGWWIEYRERSRSCPAWVFHKRNGQSHFEKEADSNA